MSNETKSKNLLYAIAVFLFATAIFFEPILDTLGVARWQEGTRKTLGVPWIAMVGYPSLGLIFIWGWRRFMELSKTWHRNLYRIVSFVVLLAIGHVLVLSAFKYVLGW